MPEGGSNFPSSTLTPLAKQGRAAGFLTHAENAERISSLVEDIRDAMMDYQVGCEIFHLYRGYVTPVLDLTATRHL